MDNTIGKNLRAAREFLGLTQLQVADILHMTEYVVNDYETGALIPDSQTIILFSKLYGISCWDILTEHSTGLTPDERAAAELYKLLQDIKDK